MVEVSFTGHSILSGSVANLPHSTVRLVYPSLEHEVPRSSPDMASLNACAHRLPTSPGSPLQSILWLILFCSGLLVIPSSHAKAVSKDSPEVRELVEKALTFLEGEPKNADPRLGRKCLVALALYKGGRPKDHARIVEAIDACKYMATAGPKTDSIYSAGLAIILLCEIDPKEHKSSIEKFAGAMAQRQKRHGGWGYDNMPTGDTSQTQYAILSYWEMVQMGFSPSVKMIDNCANWLMRTQDPTGVWGYQGKDPGSFELVEQEETNSSMLLAGMGSTMMSGHIVGMLSTAQQQEVDQQDLPPAMMRVKTEEEEKIRNLSGSGLDRSRLMETIDRGRRWFDENFIYAKGEYPLYELYSLERYKSFEELLTGDAPEEPDWYNKGYQILKRSISEDGSWKGKSGRYCATAFGTLFLLRSTQGSIKASMGMGTLVGGRGLSADLNNMQLRDGKLIKTAKPTEVDKLLGMLESDESADFDALLNSPASLKMDNVGPEEARRLQQIIKSGNPKSRTLAVRALGRLRDIDHVPTLLYAMTDPDKNVVREARDGLRLVSRRFKGFGLEDNFEDAQRYDAIEQWKQWYRRVRPNAPPLP